MAGLEALLPQTWSRGNPVDIMGDASGARYAKALDLLFQDEGADAILVLNCPTAVSSTEKAAQAVIEARRDRRRCLLTCWLGEEAVQGARHLFNQHNVPTYFTPEAAVRAFMHLVEYRRNQESLTQIPPSVPEAFSIDASARPVLEQALAEGREWLSEPEAKAVLAAYDIPIVATEVARDADAAVAAAARLGGTVVLKILSPDITHKSEVGGVVLDLRTPAMVREAAEAMQRTLAERRPDARFEGFTVQPMVDRPGAMELILGMYEDPQFGPVILFGQGGTAAEIIDDTALALPPLNMHLARKMMARTRVDALLQGFRGRPAAAIDDVALTLIKLSHLIIDVAEVVELDINPLLADEFGVLALDARIRVRRAEAPAAKRLAIRPYPKELEETIALPDGRTLLLRPVLPEDEPAFQDLFSKLSAEDIRLRFFAPKKALAHPFAARMTQIDYDREMALVLAQPGVPGRSEVYGVVHIYADPDGERAEYAILVRTDMSGLGLGPLLMRRIIEYGQARGIKELFGEVLRENRAMLKVCELLKFSRTAKEDEPGVFEVTLRL